MIYHVSDFDMSGESSPATPKGNDSLFPTGAGCSKSPALTATATGSSPSGVKRLILQQTPKTARKAAQSPNTPKSGKSRSTWGPVVIKESGTYDVMIKIKNSYNSIGLYCDSESGSKTRSTWEAAVDFEVVRREKDGEMVNYINVRNVENLKKDFRGDLINMFIDPPSQFNRLCTKFIVEKNLPLLCKYFSLLTHSKDFTKYVAEDCSEDGFKLDGSGCQEGDLVSSGGSFGEYLEFSTSARANSTVCGDENVTTSRRGKNKRITEFFQATCPPKKLSKVEQVEKDFRKACTEEGGLEKTLVSSFVGWKKIHIINIKLSENIFLEINEGKVQSIASSIASRFDPAQAVLTVIEDKEREGMYTVLHGVHLMLAMKQLDAVGKFRLLPGMEEKMIACHVVGTGVIDPAIGVYTNIRGNDIASENQSSAVLHELIYVFDYLKKSYQGDHEKAVQVVVDRISKLRRISKDETTYLRKILNWPQNILQMLIMVLKLYEKYQTVDTIGKRVAEKIKRGEKLKLTKDMFKKLSSCHPNFFEANYQAVLEGGISLKNLLIESEKAEQILKTKSLFAREADYESFESLHLKYPTKLTEDIVESFAGAIITGKNKNLKGQMLKNYVEKMMRPESYHTGLKIEVLENILEFDKDKLDNYDTVVIQMSRNCENYMDYLIDRVALSLKKQYAVLVIFDSEADCRRALVKLEQFASESKIQLVQLFFERQDSEVSKSESIQSNVFFSLMYGKFVITKPPLRNLNQKMESSLF